MADPSSTGSSSGVYVSLQTMYQEQQHTTRAVQELRADVTRALENTARVDRLEKRIRALEAAAAVRGTAGPGGSPAVTTTSVAALLTAVGTAAWTALTGG